MKKSADAIISFLFENSVFLIVGTVAGLVWANVSHESYTHIKHIVFFKNFIFGTLQNNGTRVFDFHYFINDFMMATFFAIAGKEVWEATMGGGPLSDAKRAAVPIFAAVGGMVVPAVIYLFGAYLSGQYNELSTGWAIPGATDIAFSYMIIRLIFGPGHPAIPFLLLLAIVDDAIGLMILAIFYPQEEVQFAWMALPVVAFGIGYLFNRIKIASFWPYLLVPGFISWIGFAKAGLHPALSLLPIIPIMPHAHSDKGLFNWQEMEDTTDTLTRFEKWWKNPVELVLMLFGFLNAGVLFSAVGAPTVLVISGLLLGKPIGIWLSTMIAAKGLKLGLPKGISQKELLVVGFAAGIGFTVALFVATVAFPAGPVQDAAKMGALGSFIAVLITFALAKILRVGRYQK